MGTRNVADLYLRVSANREGQSGIEQQEADCREWADRNGLAVRKVHVDRGRSAFKEVHRAGLSDAVTAITAGVADVLIVWKLDRLSRRGIAEVAAHLDEFENVGARFVSVMDGLDTEAESARTAVALLADLARSESENTGVRVERAKRHLRRSGKWIGGRPPYGLRLDPGTKRLVPDEETSVYARLIADEALAGLTLVQIARLLNSNGVESPRGGQWNASTILQLLRSPAFAGLMPQTEYTLSADGTRKYGHRVRPYLDPETLEPVCIGEGVISSEERELILGLVSSRARPYADARHGGRGASALLTGLARCARCGSRMSKAGNSYQCSSHRMGRDCEGVSAIVKSLDRYVEETVLSRLEGLRTGDPLLNVVAERQVRSEHPELFARRGALLSEVEVLQRRRTDLEDARYLRGEFTDDDGDARYDRLFGTLSERLGRLCDALDCIPEPAIEWTGIVAKELARMSACAVGSGDRRRLLGMVVDRVSVRPGRVGARFDGPSRVEITWADSQAVAISPT